MMEQSGLLDFNEFPTFASNGPSDCWSGRSLYFASNGPSNPHAEKTLAFKDVVDFYPRFVIVLEKVH